MLIRQSLYVTELQLEFTAGDGAELMGEVEIGTQELKATFL